MFLGLTAVYSAIFICGWNYSFPTQIEQTLWRGASTTIMGTLVAFWAITEFAFVWHPARQRRRASSASSAAPDLEKNPRGSAGRRGGVLGKAESLLAACRNNSFSKGPQLDIPLKAILPIYVVATFYCFARVYLYLADVLQLRALPPSAYRTVEWSDFLPHV